VAEARTPLAGLARLAPLEQQCDVRLVWGRPRRSRQTLDPQSNSLPQAGEGPLS
jgi:hypothetical protein